MKSIFENAYFGKQYKTRDGRKAIYLFVRNMYEENKSYFSEDDIWHFLIIEGKHSYTPCYANGSVVGLSDDCEDDSIVSVWQEEINEEELDKLADAETFKLTNEFDNCLDDILSLLDSYKRLRTIYRKSLKWAFKIGYRSKGGIKMENNFATKVQTYQKQFVDIKEPREQFIIGCAYIDGYKEALKDVCDNLINYTEECGTISKVHGEDMLVITVKDIIGVINNMKTDTKE